MGSFACFWKQSIKYIMIATKENGLGGKPEKTDKMPYEILKFLHQNEDTAHTLMVFLGYHFWRTWNNAEYCNSVHLGELSQLVTGGMCSAVAKSCATSLFY